MFRQLILLIAAIHLSRGLPRPEPVPPSGSVEPRAYVYVPERQQYLQYDFPLLEPQFYNFADKEPLPRVQPQIVLYHGSGTPGQPFLLQPGSPPGNFLVPQPHPGPNVILREQPPRPVFVAGYPKPAHIPPIEKDAEEIPTNPSKIPPIAPEGRKPEKIETFNEPEKKETSKKQATEAEVLAAADRNPYFNTRTNLKPGQRFFILNGQSLFSNYPFDGSYPHVQNPNVNLKYAQAVPLENLLFKNAITGRTAGGVAGKYSPENLVLFNQPENYRSESGAEKGQFRAIGNEELPDFQDALYKFEASGIQDDEAVVIDAKEYDESDDAGNDSEAVSAPEKSAEPTISQAQPGAIALAGPGGVAEAAPRGTAFVGREGVAVSSPQATAVAGPSRDEPERKSRKQNKRTQ